MRKDLLKIKKHSSELFLERTETNPKDVKLHNDVEVSFTTCKVCKVKVSRAISLYHGSEGNINELMEMNCGVHSGAVDRILNGWGKGGGVGVVGWTAIGRLRQL